MKLCITFGRFFIDNFGLMYSFGLALFVVLESIIPDQGMLVRSPGKSICKRLNVIKVIQHVIKEESRSCFAHLPADSGSLYAAAEWRQLSRGS